jgi:hypothetical protein
MKKSVAWWVAKTAETGTIYENPRPELKDYVYDDHQPTTTEDPTAVYTTGISSSKSAKKGGRKKDEEEKELSSSPSEKELTSSPTQSEEERIVGRSMYAEAIKIWMRVNAEALRISRTYCGILLGDVEPSSLQKIKMHRGYEQADTNGQLIEL